MILSSAVAGSPSRRAGVTIASEGGAALFSDGFESGDLSHTENGVEWGSSVRTAVGSTGDGYEVKTGSYSLRFRFPAADPGSDSFAEQRFNLGAYYTEIWFEYDMYVSSNYYHREGAGADNNKFFRIHEDGGTGDNFHITTEILPHYTEAGESRSERFKAHSRGVNASNELGPSKVDWFIGDHASQPIHTGQWTQIRFHYRSASARDVEDGIAEWFADGVRFMYLEYDWWGELNGDEGDPGQPGRVNGGYIWGWANSGFTQETKIYIDNFKIHTTYPGWGST